MHVGGTRPCTHLSIVCICTSKQLHLPTRMRRPWVTAWVARSVVLTDTSSRECEREEACIFLVWGWEGGG